MAHGLIDANTVPGWPSPPAGVMEECAAALVTAGFSDVVSHTPDGILVSDVDTARAFIAGYVGSAAQLAFEKDAKLAQLTELYAGKYAAGLSYVGPDGVKRTFQIDPQSQFNIDVQANAALGAILAGEPWFEGSYFVAADNSHMGLPTARDMRAFALAARSYVAGLILCNRALKDAIGAASTTGALQVIDIDASWPANP